jgi:hypothetical protein
MVGFTVGCISIRLTQETIAGHAQIHREIAWAKAIIVGPAGEVAEELLFGSLLRVNGVRPEREVDEERSSVFSHVLTQKR